MYEVLFQWNLLPFIFTIQKQISEEAALIGEKSKDINCKVQDLVKQAHNLRKRTKKLLNEVWREILIFFKLILPKCLFKYIEAGWRFTISEA